MKIAHEAPLSIFDKVQQLTDYDYFLVHLFEENTVYLEKAYECVKVGRETILDNSIFELGTAWNADKFAYWVNEMRPTYYIVPDVLDDCDKTIDSFERFMKQYDDLPGQTIAVAQGKTYNDLVLCYNYLKNDDRVDKIAMSFNHPFFQEYGGENQYYKMMNGRQHTINKMLEEGIINTSKPHHLLGCGLPQEFKAYKDYNWIDSLDTSNPVIHGIKSMWYDSQGLTDKQSVKLYTMMDEDVYDKWGIIEYNIKTFRSYCR
tara:strand:+ start:15616 stop:16395 length:780 start_codon:yes stop_codon:yes gene_type:complete